LLGGVEVIGSLTDSIDLSGTRAGFLLGYLVIGPQQCERAALAGLLWPDQPTRQARANLRQMVYDLRGRLAAIGADGLLASDGQMVRVEPDRIDDTDVGFLSAVVCCRTPNADWGCGASIDRMLAVVDGYGGRLLGTAIEAAVSDEALAWLSRQRAAVRERVHAVVTRVTECLTSHRGEAERAVGPLRRYLQYEPFDEVAHRQLMEILESAGQRESALEVFAQLRRNLRRELGVEPEAETTTVRDRISAKGSVAPACAELVTERRWLTLVIIWLRAPEISEHLEDGADTLEQARSTARAVLERHQGHVIVPHGRLFLAYFNYPRAHSRSVERAVDAALELRSRLPFAVSVSQVIHVGAAVTGSDPDLPDPQGEVSDVGLSVASVLDDDVIALTDTAARRPELRYPVGTEAVTRNPCSAYPLLEHRDGSAPPVARSAPLMGRDHELAWLADRWRDIGRESTPQTVVVQGEPGIGKTRLVWGLVEQVRAAGGECLRLRGSPPSVERPFGVLADWLADSLGDAAAVAQARDRLERALGGDAESDGTLERLMALSGLAGDSGRRVEADPVRERQRIQRAFDRFVLASLIGHMPGLVVMDDAQWADEATLEWIRGLPQRQPDGALLVVINTRGTVRELELPADTQTLMLEPLDREASMRLLQWHGPAEDAASQALVDLGAGRPLFLQWLGWLNPADEQGSRPPSGGVQELVYAHLDGLEVDRETLELGALLGDPVYPPLLAPNGDEQTVDQALETLTGVGIMERCSSDELGHCYRWCHDVYREAVREAIPSHRRRQLHSRAADGLLAKRATTAAASTIAGHLEAASRYDDASPWRLRAGHEALAWGATREAVGHFESAVDDAGWVTANNTYALDARIGLGTAYLSSYGYGSEPVEATFGAALQMVDARVDPVRYSRVLWGLWMGASSFHGFGEAQRLADDMASLAQASDDGAIAVASDYMAAVNALFTGDLPRTERAGLGAYNRSQGLSSTDLLRRFGEHSGLSGLAMAAWARVLMGQTAAARAAYDTTQQKALELDHPPTVGIVCAVGAVLHQRMDNPAGVRASLAWIPGEVGQFEYPLPDSVRLAFGTWAAVRDGQRGDVEPIEAVVERIDLVHQGASTPFRLALADAQWRIGALQAVHETLDAATRTIDTVGDDGWRPDVHLQRSRLLVHEGKVNEAARALERARQRARANGYSLAELEAVTAYRLAGLAGSNKHSERSRALLSELGHESPYVDLSSGRQRACRSGRAAGSTTR
jgi:DNA-binding SARP family transcriptional activator